MDPYAALGISRYANMDELKRAYRRQAMKWHPDRAGMSPEASQKFHEICNAYRTLSSQLKVNGGFEQADHAAGAGANGNSDDEVLREVLTEYAIGLARSGHGRDEIIQRLSMNGCKQSLAGSIAEQALRYQEDLAQAQHARNSRPDESEFKKRAFDYYTIEALLGKQDPDNSCRKRINYYLDVFNDIADKDATGLLFSIASNRFLGKIFNRAVLLFLLIATLFYFLPAISNSLPLGWIDFFQLPNAILSLMLAWSAFKRLWLLFVLGLALFAGSQLFYYQLMPWALDEEFSAVIIVVLASYLPFLILARLSNYLYYRQAKNTIESVNQAYPQLEEKLIVVRNRGGESRLGALLIVILAAFYFLHMIPNHGSLPDKINTLFSIQDQTESRDLRQLKARIMESERLFQLGEKYFSIGPDNHELARKAYFKAARYGSLLSAYKLGYMYLAGLGGEQDDARAFDYFRLATDSSLASQPHSLDLSTQWLSEAYYSLGMLYLGGYGTSQNKHKAGEMFRQAVKYNPSDTLNRRTQVDSLPRHRLLLYITPPDFDR